MGYFIIEHPVRGCFRDIDYGLGGGTPRPHFVTGRTSRQVDRFFSIVAVRRVLEKFPDDLRAECRVLLHGDGEWVTVEV